MAFKKNHVISVTYTHGYDDLSRFEGVLSDEQIAELSKSPMVVNYDINDAYHRVDDIVATKEKIKYTLTVSNTDGTKFIAAKALEFVPDVSEDAINYHTQCYNHAKSLPEYSGSVDC